MPEHKLTKDQKIAAILDMLGVHDDHHDHIRESLEWLSDETIHRQHAHCLAVKKSMEREETAPDE